MAAHGLPRQRLLAHRDTTRETSTECHHQAAWRYVFKRGDGRGLRHWMAVARDQDCGTDADPLSALGGTGEVHPNIMAECRNLGRPNALVAELFRKDCMVERLRARRQAEGVGQRHLLSILGCLMSWSERASVRWIDTIRPAN